MEGAANIKEFRPISLVGCVYKFIVKVSDKRMVKVLSKVKWLESQCAFVKRRRIMDTFLVANEVVDDQLYKKRDEE